MSSHGPSPEHRRSPAQLRTRTAFVDSFDEAVETEGRGSVRIQPGASGRSPTAIPAGLIHCTSKSCNHSIHPIETSWSALDAHPNSTKWLHEPYLLTANSTPSSPNLPYVIQSTGAAQENGHIQRGEVQQGHNWWNARAELGDYELMQSSESSQLSAQARSYIFAVSFESSSQSLASSGTHNPLRQFSISHATRHVGSFGESAEGASHDFTCPPRKRLRYHGPGSANSMEFDGIEDVLSNPPLCPICGTLYKRKYELKRHLQSIHADRKMTFEEQDDGDVIESTPDEHGKFLSCGYCCKVFTVSAEWTEHVQKAECRRSQQPWMVENQVLGILRYRMTRSNSMKDYVQKHAGALSKAHTTFVSSVILSSSPGCDWGDQIRLMTGLNISLDLGSLSIHTPNLGHVENGLTCCYASKHQDHDCLLEDRRLVEERLWTRSLADESMQLPAAASNESTEMKRLLDRLECSSVLTKPHLDKCIQLLHHRGICIHQITDSTYVVSDDALITCPVCTQGRVSMSPMLSTEVSTPSISSPSSGPSERPVRMEGRPGGFFCNDPACFQKEKSFNTRSDLEKHRKIHVPDSERPHGCTICSSRFIYSKDLRRHVATKHSDAKPFVCTSPGCKTAFRRKDHLKRHMNSKHPGEFEDKNSSDT